MVRIMTASILDVIFEEFQKKVDCLRLGRGDCTAGQSCIDL